MAYINILIQILTVKSIEEFLEFLELIELTGIEPAPICTERNAQCR